MANEFIFRKKDPLLQPAHAAPSPVPNTPIKEDSDTGEDSCIAEEFSSTEDHIEIDIKKRATIKTGKVFLSPLYAYNARDGAAISCPDRPRSISLATPTIGVCLNKRANHPRFLRVTPFETRHRDTTLEMENPPKCEGDFVENIRISQDAQEEVGTTSPKKEGSIGKIRSFKPNSGISEPQKRVVLGAKDFPIRPSPIVSDFAASASTMILNYNGGLNSTAPAQAKMETFQFTSVREMTQTKATLSGATLNGLFGRTKQLPIINDIDESNDLDADINPFESEKTK